MLQQAIDFREESDSLFNLLENTDEARFDEKTQFKDWTANEVLHHLHFWNYAANLSLIDEPAFVDLLGKVMSGVSSGGMRPFEAEWCKNEKGHALLNTWRSFYTEMSDRFKEADPKKRLKWAGPDMSVRSSITARLMETWAHGQEVFDHLGAERQEADRIKNVAVIGMNTFGWTFVNRKMEVPTDIPYVRLTAPSGEIWEWNEPSDTNKVEGDAVDFCRVVTQVRNIKDTSLNVVGDVATQWMSIAQCFAGPPEDPPAPGTRFTRS